MNYYRQNSHVLPSMCPFITLRFFISSRSRLICTGFAFSFLATCGAFAVGCFRISSIAPRITSSVYFCSYFVDFMVSRMFSLYKYLVPCAVYGNV